MAQAKENFKKIKKLVKDRIDSEELDEIEAIIENYEQTEKAKIELQNEIDKNIEFREKQLDRELANESRLKAFELIKRRKVNIGLLLKSHSPQEYNNWKVIDYFGELTQEEYDFLKGELQ